jgi:hypothetical protein
VIIKNASTLYQFAKAEDEEKGGRYARQSPTTDASNPRAQPPSAEWTRQDLKVPNCEPLGYSINDQEPVGTPAEVRASIEALQAPALHSPSVALPEEGMSEQRGLAPFSEEDL